ncbi:hypothetical protein DES36_1197 [Alkalibaculum bacchi]|uniref:DUF4320 family protein n=1 Tax=Alkalibaculum bacchi TaxID=645887 RepID=A0A366HYS9_9FIRM|nr:hypothetical protein [Alkalibaculum bacchi]RBP59282.1 hypothetical protein DES36_1197 [Alkalibaculum bacchi]
MQEATIMEIVKWFIGLLLLAMLLAAAIFFIEVGGVNPFKQQVNYQIERNGGLTENAITNINTYSENYYDGRFSVESDKLNQKVEYGEIVDYTVKGVFEIKIFPAPDVKLSFKGTGVSQVR